MEKEREFQSQSTEHNLRALFNAIPEAMFLMDRQGTVLEANEPFAARFGKSLTDCIGQNAFDLLPPDVAVYRRNKVAEVLRTGKKISFEGGLEGDSLLPGRKIHHICPLFGSDGEVNRLVVFSQDITEFKHKEESLRAAQEALDEDLQAMTKLHEISGLFVREGNVEVVFEKVIDAACTITGAEMGSIRLVDSKSGLLKITAQQGFFPPLQECSHDPTDGNCLCESVLQLREQVMVENISTCPLIWGRKEFQAHLTDGVLSFQLTPLVSRSRKPLGILTTYFRTLHHTENRVLKLLNLIAIQITDIIERTEKERALQHSEEQRRLAQDAAISGSWTWDIQTNNTTWSDELWQLYGLDPNECSPSFEAWRQTLHPDDRERVVRQVTEVACKGGDLNVEWRVQHNDGSEHWLMSRGRLVCNAEGMPLEMLGIVIDITDRKQIEYALRKSEKKFRSITEQMADMVFVTNNIGQLTYVSPAVEKIFGYTSQEVIGCPISDFIVKDERPRLMGIFNDALLQPSTLQVYEFRYIKKNGSIFDGEAHVHSYYEDGLFALIGLISDITERKRNDAVTKFRLRLLLLPDSCSIEEVLRSTLDEAERLTESSIGFFHFLDADQMTISLQVWSTSTEENSCRAEGCPGHYPLNDAGVWADAVRERRALIHNNYDELPNRKGMPNGHAKVTRELVVPIMHGEKIVAIIGIGNKADDYDQEHVKLLSALASFAWDIIARKQAELSERRIQNELVKAQKMELVGRMAGGIAHDFNNMLCVIRGHAEMSLLDSHHNESLTAALQEIIKAAEKSADLTQQLLAFARKQPLIAKVLDLNVLIGDMLNMLRRLLGEYIKLVWHPGQNLSPVTMDSSHFDQILVNLCVNARDAIVGTGTIVIETKNVTLQQSSAVDWTEIPAGEYVMLSVSDSGCGIEEKDAGHIFEPFFTTKEVGKGTGLGLSTVFGLVKQNNGSIKFSSTPGKGTEFIVYLPKYRGSDLSVKRGQQAESVKLGQETILIVDDEHEILKLSKLILQKQGYRVLTAGSPAQAIKIAEEEEGEIHLLLTDIIMPEMNGRNLSSKILLTCPRIKVLFMSGYTADIISTHGEIYEWTTLLRKPFTVRELTTKVYDTLHPSLSSRE